MMGDKITAKQAVKAAGIPVVPGSDGALTTEEEAIAAAEAIGFPVLIKAAAGGGGRGMKVAADREDDLLRGRLHRPGRGQGGLRRRRGLSWSATCRSRATSSCR